VKETEGVDRVEDFKMGTKSDSGIAGPNIIELGKENGNWVVSSWRDAIVGAPQRLAFAKGREALDSSVSGRREKGK